MLHDFTPGAADVIQSGPQTAYIGFDPTAPSLTIGNYVQIMLLRMWQMSGHKPIFLLGGATGRIGDPSGKDKERMLKSEEELDINLNFQKKQAEKFLDFSDVPNKAIFLNNYDFYKDMNVLNFLRDIGKNLTVSYMLSKESVKRRLETGLSFTEFSYQLLQANDFLHLYRHHDCKFQFGGSDQWGNITSGTEFIRRNLDSKAYALTSKLLTRSDGKKFGKSEEGNIWLDPNLTSPYKFYQFWLNADDADLGQYLRFFSLKSQPEIEQMENDLKDDPRTLKKLLAEELTIRIHSEEAHSAVMSVSEILFNHRASREYLMSLDDTIFAAIQNELSTFSIDSDAFSKGIDILSLLSEHTSISSSKGEARRAIGNNAVAINKQKVSKIETTTQRDDLIHGKYLLVENGKKNKFLIVVE